MRNRSRDYRINKLFWKGKSMFNQVETVWLWQKCIYKLRVLTKSKLRLIKSWVKSMDPFSHLRGNKSRWQRKILFSQLNQNFLIHKLTMKETKTRRLWETQQRSTFFLKLQMIETIWKCWSQSWIHWERKVLYLNALIRVLMTLQTLLIVSAKQETNEILKQ